MTGIDDAIEVTSAEAFAGWLVAHGGTEREVWVALFKKASGKQVVGFDPLLETALCHGWVDVQTKGIDAERYGIRFVPRRPGSTWSATNRAIAKRLLAEGRIAESGKAMLPPDL
jgi:uncharacterized protein YdeI (YjbR/CyaY-like superfamily)